MKRMVAVGVSLVLLAGCAATYGQPKPIPYSALALAVPAGARADSVAGLVRGTSAGLVLLAAHADSAWFSNVARASGLRLSGPTRTPPGLRMAFLAGKPVGDTTLTLPVSGGRPVLLHDALYGPRKNRHLDLMMMQVDSGTSASGAAGALLKYVATDVMQNAPMVLGLLAPNTAVADSVARLIRAVYADVRDCDGSTAEAAAAAPVRVLYGPSTQIYCDTARLVSGVGTPVLARITLGVKP
jgi:hypothetical protein